MSPARSSRDETVGSTRPDAAFRGSGEVASEEGQDLWPSRVQRGSVRLLVALGTLVLVNIVAALPGRSAARTSTALLLRAE